MISNCPHYFVLGYKESQVETLMDDLNPALALLADWIISSGNTVLSVDMLLKYLDEMDRDDIIQIIHNAKGLYLQRR